MENHGFFECNSPAEVMEVLERLSVEEIAEVETRYGCSGSELAVQIMKSKGRIIIFLSEMDADNEKGLNKPDVNQLLYRIVYLLDRFVDEKIRSDKVIEGILKDISNSIDSGLENISQSIENIPRQE